MTRPVWNIDWLGDFLWKPSMVQRPQFHTFESDSGFMLNAPIQTATFTDVTATYWIKTAVQRERFYAFFAGEPGIPANSPTKGGIRNGALAFEKEDPDRGKKNAIFQFTQQGIQKVITGPGIAGSDQSRLTLNLRMRT